MPEMRRSKQQLTEEQSVAILRDAKNTHGVLSVNGLDGFPYGVPVNYVWANGKVWIHTALAGYRHDCLAADDRVCFTVVDCDDVVEEEYTSDYASVIVFGRARLVDSAEEHYRGLKAMMDALCSSLSEEDRARISEGCSRADVYCIEPERITGKCSKRLIKTRFA